MNIAQTTRVPSARINLFLLPLASLGLGLAWAAPASEYRLDLTVTYSGPEEVDHEHPISVLLFDGPDFSGGSKMVAAGHLTENGGTFSTTELPEFVYAVAIFDPLGSFTGLSGIIPGSAIGAYAEEGAQEPKRIEIGRRTRVNFEFDDAQRIPGDPDLVVPPAVRNADKGILEIRKYTVHPGRREEFIAFFVEKTLAQQKKTGLRVVGQFRSLENENQFVWIRTYASQQERAQQLRDYYLGPDWIRVQDEAMGFIANTEVMIVAPTKESDIR